MCCVQKSLTDKQTQHQQLVYIPVHQPTQLSQSSLVNTQQQEQPNPTILPATAAAVTSTIAPPLAASGLPTSVPMTYQPVIIVNPFVQQQQIVSPNTGSVVSVANPVIGQVMAPTPFWSPSSPMSFYIQPPAVPQPQPLVMMTYNPPPFQQSEPAQKPLADGDRQSERQ